MKTKHQKRVEAMKRTCKRIVLLATEANGEEKDLRRENLRALIRSNERALWYTAEALRRESRFDLKEFTEHEAKLIEKSVEAFDTTKSAA